MFSFEAPREPGLNCWLKLVLFPLIAAPSKEKDPKINQRCKSAVVTYSGAC
jgi:hypothetical protein